MNQVCDICSVASVAWAYPCEDFLIGTDAQGRPYGSAGSWAMCEECAVAYEQDGPAGLTDRSVAVQADSIPAEFVPAVRTALAELHRKFHLHRVGPRIRDELLLATCPHERYAYMEEEGSAFLPPGWYCTMCGSPRPPRAVTVDGRTRGQAL